MSDKINLLMFLADLSSCWKEIASELIKDKVIDFCYCASAGEHFESEDGTLASFCFEDGYQYFYKLGCDFSDIPAVSKEILEKMLPYESMAIKLGNRRRSFPCIDYEEEKMFYYQSVRYWFYILKKYNINTVYFERGPHGQLQYIIYCLAQIENIRTIISCISAIPNIWVYGDRIENIGCDIKDFYCNVASKMDISNIQLNGEVQKYYLKLVKLTEKPDLQLTRTDKTKRIKKHNYVKKYLYKNGLGIRGRFFSSYRKLILFLVYIVKHHDINTYRKFGFYLEQLKRDQSRILYFNRHIAMGIKSYNRIAELPVSGEPYIYFALQEDPEETTTPRAGVFSDQYRSIILLERIARRFDIKIYVKEHYVQSFRDKRFYRALQEIPNVRLIKSYVSSYELIRDSLAVSTQTGTCILEGAVFGKKALVFGGGHMWKGLPSVIEILDEKQGIQVMRGILNHENEFSQEEIKRYFYAIQKKSFLFHPYEDAQKKEYSCDKTYVEECTKERVSYLKTALPERLGKHIFGRE